MKRKPNPNRLVLDVRHMSALFRKLLAYDPTRFAQILRCVEDMVDAHERPFAPPTFDADMAALTALEKTRGAA